MVQVVLIRPGSTDFDLQGRIQGTLDIPLTPQGRQEALGALEALKGKPIEAVYAAPCQAALETGDLIARAIRQRVKRVDRLRNLDHGLWQGMCVKEIQTRQPKVYRQWQEHPETICPPEGEMVSEAITRVDAALGRFAHRHRYGTFVLVVPEPLASLIRSRITNEKLADVWKTGSESGKWEVLQFGPEVSNPGHKPAA